MSVIGNSLKSIYSRITSVNAAVDSLNAIGISTKEASGEMRKVDDILSDLAGQWKSLSAEQQQNIGLNIAGRYQLSRFLILMNQFEEAQSAANTALNSSGSAYRENEKYLKSYEARINQVQNKWTETVIAMQNSGLGAGMFAVLEGGMAVANTATSIIDEFGILPTVVGTATVAFLLFNKTLRTGTLANGQLLLNFLKGAPAGFRTLQASMSGAILANRAFTATTTMAGVAVKGLTTALVGTARFLAGSFLPIAGFMLLSSAITSVIEKFVKLREEQKALRKEIEEINAKNISALSEHREEVDSLIASYTKMYNERQQGTTFSSAKEKEYLEIQQKLGELFPSLIKEISTKGEVHLKSAEQIEEEVKATEKLLKLEQERVILNAKDTYGDSLDEFNKRQEAVEKAEKKLEYLRREKDRGVNEVDDFEEVNKMINAAEIELQIAQAMSANASKNITNDVIKTLNAISSTLSTKITPEIMQESQKIVSSLDFSSLSDGQLEDISKQVSNFIQRIQEAFNSGDRSSYNALTKEFDVYLASLSNGKVKVESFGLSFEKLTEKIEQKNKATEEGKKILDEYGVEVDEQGNKIDKLTDSYNNAISNISSLNGALNELNDGHQLSADKIGFLMEKYPHLLEFLGDETALRKAIQEEIINEEKIAKQAILNKLSYNEQFYNSVLTANASFVNQFKSHYGIDLQNFKNLATAKMAVDDALRKSLSEAWTAYSTQVTNAVSAAQLATGGFSGSMTGSILQAVNAGKMASNAFKYAKASQSFQGIFMDSVSAGTQGIGTNGLPDKKGSSGSKGSKEKEKSPEKPVEQYLSDEYAKSLDNLNLLLKESETRQKSYNKTSAEYSKELDTQIDLHTQIKKLNNDERYRLAQKNKALESTLVSMGDFNKLSSKQREKHNEISKEIDNNTQAIIKLKSESLSYNETIQGLSYEKVNSEAKKFTDSIEDIDYQLSLSRSIQSLHKEGSEEWRKEVEKQNKLLDRKSKVTTDYKAVLQKLLNEENLSVDAKKELTKTIDELTLSYWDLQNGIKSNTDQLIKVREEAADKAIDALKRSYEMQRDYETKLKDHQIKQLEEVHKLKMDMYDEDLRRFEEITNAKIREIDDKSDEDSFNKDIAKLQKTQMDLQTRISTLSMSTSLADQAKKRELEEELAEVIEQINQKQTDRSKELRKRELSDKLDSFKKEIEAKKKTETDSYNATRDRLESERKNIEYHYNEMLANTAEFERLKMDMINGNTAEMQNKLQSYLTTFKNMNKDTIRELEMSWTELQNLINGIEGGMSGVGSGGGGSSGGSNPQKQADWQKYLSNKRVFEYSNPDESTKKRLREENDKLRSKWGFPDGSWAQLKDIPMYHEGGVVDGSKNRVTEMFNKLFNTKPNEQIVKALKGELFVPSKNIAANFIPNMQNLIHSITPQPNMAGGNVYNMSPTIHVNVNGGDRNIGKHIANQTFEEMNRIWRDWGKK